MTSIIDKTHVNFAFETFLSPKMSFSSSEFHATLNTFTKECIIAALLIFLFLELLNYFSRDITCFVFMYSEAKSQYSFIFKLFLSFVAFPTLSNRNYRETESSAYERCFVRLHKRHSFVLVALVAHSFASFLVRYVFPLRATPHEKST